MQIVLSDVNKYVNNYSKDIVINEKVIFQSFESILVIPVGSVYRRPMLGSQLPFLLQNQADDDLAFECKAYAIQALRLNEPRATVIEEAVRFYVVNADTIRGEIPFVIPATNIRDTFRANFIRDNENG